MTDRIRKKISGWMTLFYQSLIILTIVFNIIFWPVKAFLRFNKVEARIAIIQRDYEKHCIDQEKAMQNFANLDVTNLRLNQLCDNINSLVEQIKKCQENDEKFREELYRFLGENKKAP